MRLAPETPEALGIAVRDAQRLHVPLLGPAPEDGSPFLDFSALRGNIRHDVADGVVSCWAGTTLAELNAELGRHGRALPYKSVWPDQGANLCLAVLILLGLPHAQQSGHGSWRDWLLGATVVTAEGTLVKSGSRVVKSVAGYDAHKLLIGSRGSLFLPAELIFRTAPAPGFPQDVQNSGDKVKSILRVPVSEVDALAATLGEDALFVDRSSGTVWCSRSVQDLPSIPAGWSIDPFRSAVPDDLVALHQRAKAVLDPTAKLAPGAWTNL